MIEAIAGATAAAVGVGLVATLRRTRTLGREVDALRAEIAVARIEGVLAGTIPQPQPQPERRRRRHLYLVPVFAAVSGIAGWLRSHWRPAAAATAAAAVATAGAFYLTSGGGGADGASRPEHTTAAPAASPPPLQSHQTPAASLSGAPSAEGSEPRTGIPASSSPAASALSGEPAAVPSGSASPGTEAADAGDTRPPALLPAESPLVPPADSGPTPPPSEDEPPESGGEDDDTPPGDADQAGPPPPGGLICLDIDLGWILDSDLCLL